MNEEIGRRVREGMPVLHFVAKRISRRIGAQIPVDDLVALGHPALLQVAEHYDPNRSSFAAYAALKLKWAILDGLRKDLNYRAFLARANALSASMFLAEAQSEEKGALHTAESPEEPLAEEEYQSQLRGLLCTHAAALCAGLLLGGEPFHESPEDKATREETRLSLLEAVKQLPERERVLIERHYFGGEIFDTIARDLGISRSWASRLHAHAIQRLGEALRSQGEMA